MNGQKDFNYQQEIEMLRELFKFDFIGLALIQSADQRFEHKWKYVSGNLSDRYKRIVLQSGKGVAGNVIKTGKPTLVEDVGMNFSADELFNYPIVVVEKLSSFGAIPLFKNNRVQGVLLVAYREGRQLTPQKFKEFREAVGPRFGPYYNKEMVKL
ncbi:GAF domain-containing protein [Sporosarcina sp. 179-K 3D1 HS]|uniref:GAF domain-containing protein n=1 Tax=Sporosarcina sp. 179-K 3D1 HS TaxID=3232169 RepID=UPI0039A337F3